MPRVTTDERRINYLCMEVGFQPEHVYEFTKMMLIEYKKGRDMLRFPISQKTVEEMYEEKLRLRHEFLEIMKPTPLIRRSCSTCRSRAEAACPSSRRSEGLRHSPSGSRRS